jgi:hypothetical protein
VQNAGIVAASMGRITGNPLHGTLIPGIYVCLPHGFDVDNVVILQMTFNFSPCLSSARAVVAATELFSVKEEETTVVRLTGLHSIPFCCLLPACDSLLV